MEIEENFLFILILSFVSEVERGGDVGRWVDPHPFNPNTKPLKGENKENEKITLTSAPSHLTDTNSIVCVFGDSETERERTKDCFRVNMVQ